jgi:hypothetical protein
MNDLGYTVLGEILAEVRTISKAIADKSNSKPDLTASHRGHYTVSVGDTELTSQRLQRAEESLSIGRVAPLDNMSGGMKRWQVEAARAIVSGLDDRRLLDGVDKETINKITTAIMDIIVVASWAECTGKPSKGKQE